MKVKCALLLAAVLVNVGCYSRWDLAPRSLVPLNDYSESHAVVLTDTGGGKVKFDSDTALHFTETAHTSREEKFLSIQTNGSTFTGTAQPDGHTFAIDLAQVVGIQAKKFSFFKTSIAIGIPVIVAATIIGAVVAANSGSGASTDTSGTDSSMMLSGMSLRRK